MTKNTLFILIDCLRADKCWGNNRTAKTPTIDLLCQKGTVFTQTISTTTTTTPSVASILTGLYPFVHGIKSLYGYKLRCNCRTLAEIFKENGYNTYTEVTGPLVPEIGLNRGFDEYKLRDSKDNMYSPWYDTLLSKFRNKEFKEPWFIFIHFFDLHIPRALSPKYDNSNFGKNIYERALSSLDARLGDLLKYIDDDTIIVFNADHGEKFPETLFELIFNLKLKQYYFGIIKKLKLVKKQNRNRLYFIGHGFHVYDYLVRVPLIFVGKKIFPENKWISDQVRQIDIFPTIIDALKLEYSSDYNKIHGRSLLPLIKNRRIQEVPAYCEACGVKLSDKSMWLAGIRTSKYKYVYAPYSNDISDELYDLENDPDEKKNIIQDKPEIAQELKQKLEAIRKVDDEKGRIKDRIRGLKAIGKM